MDISQAILSQIEERELAEIQIAGSISLSALKEIACRFNTSLKTAEIEALKLNVIPERYLRNLPSLAIENQIQLLQSSVCVIGLGGLGGEYSVVF